MLARVITLRFEASMDSFDDGPLRDFLKDKDVRAIREYFFVKDDTPYLAVLVTYFLPQAQPAPLQAPARVREDTSWRAWVTEPDLPLFNALRDWRSERSKREGVPPYVICTNRQFAAMVKTRPQSLTALGDIAGFGRGKLEKYGQDILALLMAPPSTPAPAPPPSTSEETPNAHSEG